MERKGRCQLVGESYDEQGGWLCYRYLQLAIRAAAAITAGRGQVFPEESMVDVATTMEVEEGRHLGGLVEVALGLGFVNSRERGVQAVHIGLVVLAVVQLHDFARDVRL